MLPLPLDVKKNEEIDYIKYLLLGKKYYKTIKFKNLVEDDFLPIIKMFIVFKDFLEKNTLLFEVNRISRTLQEILSTFKVDYIRGLSKLCDEIIESFGELNELIEKNHHPLDMATKANFMLLDMSSFYTMIAEGDPEEDIKNLVNAVIKKTESTIKIYEYGLMPDGQVVTKQGEPPEQEEKQSP
jgi:hypothetical protein